MKAIKIIEKIKAWFGKKENTVEDQQILSDFTDTILFDMFGELGKGFYFLQETKRRLKKEADAISRAKSIPAMRIINSPLTKLAVRNSQLVCLKNRQIEINCPRSRHPE